MNNIFRDITHIPGESEVMETIHHGNIHIERILSSGHVTPPGEGYDQETDEFVILLSGKAAIRFEGREEIHLTAGDYLFIPSHAMHWVTYTSSEPPCVWLAVHGDL